MRRWTRAACLLAAYVHAVLCLRCCQDCNLSHIPPAAQVDYAVTPEELQLHFQSCGTVNRVTILTDKSGNPKGFAYVEFLEAEAVANALLLNDSELHARKIKVVSKRTNVPGLKQRGGGRGGRGRGRGGLYPATVMMDAYGQVYVPLGGRGRGRGGFRGGRGGGRGRGVYKPY